MDQELRNSLPFGCEIVTFEAMPRPESHKTGQRTLSMVGKRTYAVTIPIDEVRNLGWEKGDALVVRRYRDQLIIERDNS